MRFDLFRFGCFGIICRLAKFVVFENALEIGSIDVCLCLNHIIAGRITIRRQMKLTKVF